MIRITKNWAELLKEEVQNQYFKGLVRLPFHKLLQHIAQKHMKPAWNPGRFC